MTIWIFGAWVAGAQSLSAQGVSPVVSSQASCANGEVKGFAQFPGPLPQLYTNFLMRPGERADGAEIRRHLIYSRILLVFSISRLSQSSPEQCLLADAAVDLASRQLKFILFLLGKAGPNGSAECSLNRCASALSNLLQSAAIDQSTLADVTSSIVNEFHRYDSTDIKDSPRLSARRAAEEALRRIYPPNSGSLPFADTSAAVEDFKSIKFDEFAAWFIRQRNALRASVSAAPPIEPGIAAGSTDDNDCAPSANIDIAELNMDHSGWGHRSLILINNAYDYRAGWPLRIANVALRGFCGLISSNPADLGSFPWSEMSGRLQCQYLLVDRDRWLILFAKQDDRPSPADMRRFAQGVAKTLEHDKCLRPHLQLLVVNFLQPQ